MWNLLYSKINGNLLFSIIIFTVGWEIGKLSRDHNSLIFHFKKSKKKNLEQWQ